MIVTLDEFGENNEYELEHVLPFTSERKCMSVIVKNP